MDRREFWATRSKLAEYHAISFAHPAFSETFRLVANQFSEVVLSGFVHRPVGMDIQPPEQKGDVQPKLTMAFPRQVVGREFKKQLARVAAAGGREPIRVTYAIYTGSTDAPQVTWNLFAAEEGGVQFGTDTVQVSASDDNLMRLRAAVIYQPTVFTGLALM
jgi:hypothetical protein